jgi:mRNA interferase MazF
MTPGNIIAVQFPFAYRNQAKLRPALVLGRLPGENDDWLTCMISSRLRNYVPGFDEIIAASDADFPDSGLKVPSVVRVGRLFVVERQLMPGAIGKISPQRLQKLRTQLTSWLTNPQSPGEAPDSSAERIKY